MSIYPRGEYSDYLHRELAEKSIGRKLLRHEHVHHVDLDPSNSSNNNLVICQDDAYHKLLHTRTRVVNLGGNPNTDKYCSYHNVLHPLTEFSTRPSSPDGFHNTCRVATNEYRKAKGLNVDKFNWRGRLMQQYRRLKKKYTKRDISWI